MWICVYHWTTSKETVIIMKPSVILTAFHLSVFTSKHAISSYMWKLFVYAPIFITFDLKCEDNANEENKCKIYYFRYHNKISTLKSQVAKFLK